jgi:hypothetical protein
MLDPELFRNPTTAYRGMPFWAWNCRLDGEQLLRQIDLFQDMGFGGFLMHARTGLATPYLGNEFMEIVRACVDKARDRKMLAGLYDEDRWPSGFAGGLVTTEEKFRARFLLFTPISHEERPAQPATRISQSRGARSGQGKLIGRYEVILKEGRLSRYRRLSPGEDSTEGDLWYAYQEIARPSAWFGHQTYVDTLNKKAIERFVEVTYERYRSVVGGDFGQTVPLIFTDEPQLGIKQVLDRAGDRRDLVFPWTDDLAETYQQTFSQDLEDHLPELFWELPEGRASQVRYRYFDHTTERFALAYADTLGAWCGRHGIALTGHMMMEGELFNQTQALGECMRHFRAFHVPGIDILCDWRELNTAKQAQSAAHQFGREGVVSELYGVTGWDYDFAGYKAQGDWQAALGVTLRVPHLAWVSMAGEAKRDYPASIAWQSPWFREFPLIEDHFARVNTVLTRGLPRVRVGVIHPVESYWLCFGPKEQTQRERDMRETHYTQLTDWLLFGLVDFDFVCESLLPELCPEQNGPAFQVGKMRYDVVLVPHLRTLRSTTLQRLEAFVRDGGAVVFAGEIPGLIDAEPSPLAGELAQKCTCIAMSRPEVMRAIEPWREIEIRLAGGERSDSLLHQFREDGEHRHLFICNTDRRTPRENTRIRIRGSWSVVLLDTLTGRQSTLGSAVEDGWTLLDWSFPAHGHLLCSLSPRLEDPAPFHPLLSNRAPATGKWEQVHRLEEPGSYSLSEPNTLLLDQAEWSWDQGPWQPREEILRIGNQVRKHLALPPRHGHIEQPWVDTAAAPVLGRLRLRFRIHSNCAVSGARLALENPAQTLLTLNGSPVAVHDDGWWVDEAIRTVPLPELHAGENILTITLPLTRKTDVEWCYLLGDFGVDLKGPDATIFPLPETICFGDWTTQGFPFYTGNLSYHCRFKIGAGHWALSAPHFKNPLLSLCLEGQDRGRIAFAPFRQELGQLSAGEHRLVITAFGHRANAFGCLHNIDPKLLWIGPDAWRSQGENWSYNYALKPMGILSSPLLERRMNH